MASVQYSFLFSSIIHATGKIRVTISAQPPISEANAPIPAPADTIFMYLKSPSFGVLSTKNFVPPYAIKSTRFGLFFVRKFCDPLLMKKSTRSKFPDPLFFLLW